MWKPISEHPDYQVSDAGEVRSSKHRKPIILKLGIGSTGYPLVVLCQNGKRSDCNVHQLVLTTFIGQCPQGMEAHHLDGNKRNSRLENLEYVTHSENQLHAFRTGLQAPTRERAVCQFTKDEQFIAEYRSQREASRQTGVSQGHISNCCLGKRKTTGGFRWEFANAS